MYFFFCVLMNEQEVLDYDMLIFSLTILCILVLHVTCPFPTFFSPKLVSQLHTETVVSCLAHAFVEEYIFRHLFWSMLPRGAVATRPISLLWLNVTIFWLVHILLLYHSRHNGQQNADVYASTSYNVSLIFMTMMLNAIYLETGPLSLANCIFVHALVLLLWSLCLGGADGDYFSKYKPPRMLSDATVIVRRYISDAFPASHLSSSTSATPTFR